MDFICRKIKKSAILIALAIFILLPIIVFILIMSHSSKMEKNRIVPYNYPGSFWESEVPYIHLEVPNKPGEGITGYCLVDNDKKKVFFSMTAGPTATLVDLDKYEKAIAGEGLYANAVLIKANCQYSDETIIMRIKEDMLFNGKYKTITLYKKHTD